MLTKIPKNKSVNSSYLLKETEEKHNNEDDTLKTYHIEKRIKDMCDENGRLVC